MSWTVDLSWGKKREQDFLLSVPFLGLIPLDGTGPDFVDKQGCFYELKSERRTAQQTPNIAVEVESSFKKKGAIFHAQQSQFICFYFICGSTFIYRTADLILVARAYRRKYGAQRVRGSSAKVVLLPRRMLLKLEVKLCTKKDGNMLNNFLSNSSNLEYHADKSYLSSSGLKLLLKDPAEFKRQYIDGERSESSASHFDEGSAVHTLILEPEKFENQYAIFPGLRKSGHAFEEFKEANTGKVILSAAQMHRCENLAAACRGHKIAIELLSNGLPEHTMLGEILDVKVKCRHDYINIGSYIVDLKTTSAESGSDMFRATVDQYGYALSAALYAQIAFDNTKKLHDFYWIVLSKSDYKCMVYKASSDTLTIGAAQVTQAVVKYKQCKESNIWTLESNIDILSEEVEEI